MSPAPVVRARTELTTPIWNPEAAANWSLAFSPAFGSYLHMRNWSVLGEPEKARKALTWFIVSLAWLAAYPVLVLALPESPLKDVWIRAASLVYLALWYLAFARTQMAFVKRNFGERYARKKWGAPLGIAAACGVAYFGLSFFLGMIFGLIRGA